MQKRGRARASPTLATTLTEGPRGGEGGAPRRASSERDNINKQLTDQSNSKKVMLIIIIMLNPPSRYIFLV